MSRKTRKDKGTVSPFKMHFTLPVTHKAFLFLLHKRNKIESQTGYFKFLLPLLTGVIGGGAAVSPRRVRIQLRHKSILGSA